MNIELGTEQYSEVVPAVRFTVTLGTPYLSKDV